MARKSRKWRTVDVARRAGYSVQQIRDLEDDGVLPPVSRTPTGYRVYDDVHVHATLAYRAFAAAIGPVDAKRLMRADVADIPDLVDAAHAGLHRARRDLRMAQRATAAIVEEPVDDVRPADSMSITELARALDVRPSTLRHWEAEGLLAPERTVSGVRRYTPRHVRDARVVHQLRQAGYRVARLRLLMPQLEHTDRDEILDALAHRETDLRRRSRCLISAAAELEKVLTCLERNAPNASPNRGCVGRE
ncbi:MAG TPA: MerR family transcriptional regulator [Candidatus Stackebrandtia excrementipullorum]|nr:MerR family transcriptional regulator [Candidatus Stackebrandtia excrementipullorum]